MEHYEDGTIIEIDGKQYALAAWYDEDQLCPQEVVYAGYEHEDWAAESDAPSIVIERQDIGWYVAPADSYQERFHTADNGITGNWASHGSTARVIGDAYELWAPPE